MLTEFMISLLIGTFAAGIAFHDSKKVSKHFLYTIDVITLIVFVGFYISKCNIEFDSPLGNIALLFNLSIFPGWIYWHFKCIK